MSAIISNCGRYRYMLSRDGSGTEPPLVFIMLNPSTADATDDDPTIRRCRAFARDLGHAGIIVLNLYAMRSTDPRALWSCPDPVGDMNDTYLQLIGGAARFVVCAWGANARPDRVHAVVDVLTTAGVRMMCLGTTQAGAPRHPLYVPTAQPLRDWHPT